MNLTLFDKDIEAEEDLLEHCRNKLKGLPKGTLSSYVYDGKQYYKSYHQEKQRYLGRGDKSEVIKLKKRRLLTEIALQCENNLELMRNLRAGYKVCDPFQIQLNLPVSYQDDDRELIYDLGLADHIRSGEDYRDSEKLYHTLSGITVRSRIEALIADLYTQKGITFIYEPTIVLDNGVTLHPDFGVYSASEQRYKYHEHVGLLSDSNYKKSYLWKLDQYTSAGFFPGYDIMFTYEKPGMQIDFRQISIMIDIFMS